MTSFFCFVSKRAMYLDGRISLAHVRCTYLSQVIKLQNKIKYTVVNVLNSYIHWKKSTYQKINKYAMCN
jgi:predicted small secreted protein